MGKEEIDHKKIWGAGYYAGIEAAKKETGDNMNQAKQDKTFDSLTSIAKKIYECVPKQEAWGTARILNEYERSAGQKLNSSIKACLIALKEKGLIYEPEKGLYKQAIINKPKLKSVKKPEPKTKQLQEIRNPSLIISELTEKLTEFAQEMEIAALEIAEYMEDAEIKVEKMKQLQSLLKSIND